MDTIQSELTPEQEMAAAFAADVKEEAYTPPTEGAPPVVETPPGEAVAVATTEGAPEETPAPVVQEPAWTPVEIEWNGQKVVVDSLDKAKQFMQMGQDYTRKTQILAEERRQVHEVAAKIVEVRQREQAEMRAFLQDPARVRTYLASLTASGAAIPAGTSPQEGQQPPTDPDDFATIQQLQQEAQRLRADLAKEKEEFVATARKEAQAAIDEVETARLEASYRMDFDSTIRGLMQQSYPVLGQAYDAAEIQGYLKAEGRKAFEIALQMNPNQPVDPAVVRNAMITAAKGKAERIENMWRQREKEEAVRRTALVAAAPEPPGGVVPPQPSSKKFTSLNDPDLTRAAIDDIEALIRAAK